MNDAGSVLLEGHLIKKPGLIGKWKKRWFVLTAEDLLYYDTKDLVMPRCGLAAMADGTLRALSVWQAQPQFAETHMIDRIQLGLVNGVVEVARLHSIVPVQCRCCTECG